MELKTGRIYGQSFATWSLLHTFKNFLNNIYLFLGRYGTAAQRWP